MIKDNILSFEFNGDELKVKTIHTELIFSVTQDFSGILDHQSELFHHLSLILQSMAVRKMGEEQQQKKAIDKGYH